MKIHIVRRGDSLYSIARAGGTDVKTLAGLNELGDPARLSVGQSIIIPDNTHPAAETEVCGCAHPGMSARRLDAALPFLSYLCPFSYRTDENGLVAPIDDAQMISAAWDAGCAPLLTLTNIGASGGFSSDIAHGVFADTAARDALIENTLALLKSRGYCGVNLNFEYIQPYDREGCAAFLERMSEALHAQGHMFFASAAPRTSDGRCGVLYAAHDYAVRGRLCDRVVVMTYDWGYAYSAPRAVSPVGEMRRVLDYAVTKIPPSKILLGFSCYGYDWRLPWKQGQAARVISSAAAADLAASVSAQIRFDAASQAPHFNYTDPAGVLHEVWFEDARSIRARLGLVREYGLAGISIWTLNMCGRTPLAVLESEFSTEKIV